MAATTLSGSTPNFLGELHDHPEFRPLLVFGQYVALLGRGKAALRRETILIERRELTRFLDAALDVVLLLQRAALRRDQPEHHHLVALRQEPHRLEATGTVGVVFEEIAVVVDG